MSLDLNMMGADQETLPATKQEIGTAIITRFALTATDTQAPDILELAEQLGEILAPYGLAWSDLWQGIREPKRLKYDPT